MDHQDIWNLIDIVVAMMSGGFNIAYYFAHVNGKKYIRLWIGIILLIIAAGRTMVATGLWSDMTFIDFIRPFSVVIYMAFSFGPYIDWNTPKIKRGNQTHDR